LYIEKLYGSTRTKTINGKAIWRNSTPKKRSDNVPNTVCIIKAPLEVKLNWKNLVIQFLGPDILFSLNVQMLFNTKLLMIASSVEILHAHMLGIVKKEKSNKDDALIRYHTFQPLQIWQISSLMQNSSLFFISVQADLWQSVRVQSSACFVCAP